MKISKGAVNKVITELRQLLTRRISNEVFLHRAKEGLVESDIRKFERTLMDDYPVVLFRGKDKLKSITKWDIIAKISYLRDQLGNVHDKLFEANTEIRRLKSDNSILRAEYDKLEAELIVLKERKKSE